MWRRGRQFVCEGCVRVCVCASACGRVRARVWVCLLCECVVCVCASAESICVPSVCVRVGCQCRRAPTPKQVNIKPRSASMPSTALSIDPSLPRSALPDPHTETNVVEAVHIRLAQIEMVTNRCRHAWKG